MKLFIFIFGGIGIALLAGAGYAYYYSRSFIDNARTAAGTITGLHYHESSRNKGGSYYPTVQFTAQDGKSYTVTSNSGSNPASYDVGEQVKVYYNPEDPTDILLPDFFSMWGVTLILGFIGTVFTLIGGGVLFSGHKKEVKVY